MDFFKNLFGGKKEAEETPVVEEVSQEAPVEEAPAEEAQAEEASTEEEEVKTEY